MLSRGLTTAAIFYFGGRGRRHYGEKGIGMIRETIEAKLHGAFAPTHLEVSNESYRHNVPAGSESHFKVVLVSEHFAGLRVLSRHRAIYGVLADELAGGVHALALHTYTPQEWAEQQNAVPSSPPCGGAGIHA